MHPSCDNSFNYINYNSPISPSSSLYHIPSPPMHYEDELLLLQALILQQQQSQPLEEESNNIVLDTIADASINNKNGGTNKRAPKKDRHSKITTAHGPRDRRMRLSLDVAREFFDLQDTLGFDKASKTVDWLLTKSRSAIREVAASLGLNNYDQPSPGGGANSASSAASECEAYCTAGDDAKAKLPSSANKGKSKKKAKPARIQAPFLALTKESRKKARERARERTMMKRKLGAMAHNGFKNWSPFDGGEESGTNQQNRVGMFSQVPVMEEQSSQMGSRVNMQILGTNQQSNAGIFCQQVEEPEVELLSSQFHIHVNKQLSPFRDFPAATIW